MAMRVHVLAALGTEPTAFEKQLEMAPEALGPWLLAAGSVWQTSGSEADWSLSLLARSSGGMSLRATTVDDALVEVSAFHGGQRLLSFVHYYGGDEDESRETSTARATRLAELLRSAGAEPDEGKLTAVLCGDVEPPEDETEGWYDVPDLLEALGVHGMRDWLSRKLREDDEEEDEEEDDEDDEAGCNDDEWPAHDGRGDGLPRSCFVGLALMLGLAVGGAVFGKQTAGWFGGVAGALLGLLIVPGLTALYMWITARRAMRALESFGEALGEALDSASTGSGQLAAMPVARRERAELLLESWGDLAMRLEAQEADHAQSGRDGVIAQLNDDADLDGLGRRIDELRERLLDASLAGEPLQPLEAEFERLCAELAPPESPAS